EVHTVPKTVTRHTIAEEDENIGRILLVEDYPTNQQVALKHLQSAGYQVDLAINGKYAVDAFKQKRFDCILMDIQMPEMDGFEATAKIRAHEEKRHKYNDLHLTAEDKTVLSPPPERISIIAMTAHAISGYKEKCINTGMDDFISKPLKRKELLAMVGKWIRRDSGHIEKPCDESVKKQSGNRLQGKDSSLQDSENNILKEDTPMNFERSVEEFEGDKDLLMEVLVGFVENVWGQMEIIRRAISNGDADVVRREAHSIKGGAANINADSLARAAFALEVNGKSGGCEGSTEKFEKFEKEFYRLEAYTRKIG
ncbi:MAG: response regulator, partial [Thermodesulfobacteriota bacterium]|nr:response regulator [Thermodesulfobacteriota bacterium]